MTVKKGRKDFFWLSYSDLMTSLFFIMLVLFIVVIVKMQVTNRELRRANGRLIATNEQYENILQLEKQFNELSRSTSLLYVEDRKTFIAKDFIGIEIFEPNEDQIKPEYLSKVREVGRDLEKLLKKLYEHNSDFNYLLVIEGLAANDWKKLMDPDKLYNYNLSYARALRLYNTWKRENIDLRKYNTEILICGSGLNGINRDTKIEDNNKRFVIQVIPKIARPGQNKIAN